MFPLRLFGMCHCVAHGLNWLLVVLSYPRRSTFPGDINRQVFRYLFTFKISCHFPQAVQALANIPWSKWSSSPTQENGIVSCRYLGTCMIYEDLQHFEVIISEKDLCRSIHKICLVVLDLNDITTFFGDVPGFVVLFYCHVDSYAASTSVGKVDDDKQVVPTDAIFCMRQIFWITARHFLNGCSPCKFELGLE